MMYCVCIISQDGVTHSNRRAKLSVTFEWTAPPGRGTGPLHFTYVKKEYNFIIACD